MRSNMQHMLPCNFIPLCELFPSNFSSYFIVLSVRMLYHTFNWERQIIWRTHSNSFKNTLNCTIWSKKIHRFSIMPNCLQRDNAAEAESQGGTCQNRCFLNQLTINTFTCANGKIFLFLSGYYSVLWVQ